MCNRFWKLHTCGHRWMCPLVRCEKPAGIVKTAGHVLGIPHGGPPSEASPGPFLPSHGNGTKATQQSRKLPGAPVAQMITPQSSPSATFTPSVQSDTATTSYPSFTVDPTSLTNSADSSFASHPAYSDPDHAVNNIENLIGVPCNDCLEKAAEKQAIAHSKSKRRALHDRRHADDDYYLNAEGGLDDTMRDANGEPCCEVPEEARWQESNKHVVPPPNAGVKEPGWTKKRRRSSPHKQPRPQVRRSRRNGKANEDDESSEDGSEYGSKPRRKTKQPSAWALRMRGEEERKKAAEAKQKAAIDNSRNTMQPSGSNYSSTAGDDSVAPTSFTTTAAASSDASITAYSGNALAHTSSRTNRTRSSSRIAFGSLTHHDPNNRRGTGEEQEILRSQYLKDLEVIQKKTRNTFKVEDESVSKQWKGNKGRAGKLNAMYYRLASTYEPAADGPDPYEVAEQRLAQKRAREAAEDEVAEPEQPATSRRSQRRKHSNKKKKAVDEQSEAEPAAEVKEPATVAPQAIMRPPTRHDRIEDGIRSFRLKRKNKGSRRRAEQLSAEAAIAKARADLLAAEARAAELEVSGEDSPEHAEAVAAQRRTHRGSGVYQAQDREREAYSESLRHHRPSHDRDELEPFSPHPALRQGAPDPYLANYNSGYMRSSPHLNPYQSHGYTYNSLPPDVPGHGHGRIINAHGMHHAGHPHEVFSSSPPDALPQPSQRPSYPVLEYAGNSQYGPGGGYGTYGMQHDHRQAVYLGHGMHPGTGYQASTLGAMSRHEHRYQHMHHQDHAFHGGHRSSSHEREADQPITAASTIQLSINHGSRNNRVPPRHHDTGSSPRSARVSHGTPRAAVGTPDVGSHASVTNEDGDIHARSNNPHTQGQHAAVGQSESTSAATGIGHDNDAEGSVVSPDEFRDSTARLASDHPSSPSRYPDGSTTYHDITRARLSSIRSHTRASISARGTPASNPGTAVTNAATIKSSRRNKSRSPHKSPHKRTTNGTHARTDEGDQYSETTSSRRRRPVTTSAQTSDITAVMQETLASRRTTRTSARRVITYAEGSSDVEGEGNGEGEAVNELCGPGGDTADANDDGQQRE